jgi:hypothetical protein
MGVRVRVPPSAPAFSLVAHIAMESELNVPRCGRLPEQVEVDEMPRLLNCPDSIRSDGDVAERLGRGLQILVRRFESARRLQLQGLVQPDHDEPSRSSGRVSVVADW